MKVEAARGRRGIDGGVLGKCLLTFFIVLIIGGLIHETRSSSLATWLEEVNKEFEGIRRIEAQAAWNASVKITKTNQLQLKRVQVEKERLRNRWCEEAQLHLLRNEEFPPKAEESRQIWFMCRGPRYSQHLAKAFEEVQQELYKIYHETIACFESPDRRRIVTCEHGEPDLTRRMSRDRNPERLRSIWSAWHDAVGTPKARRLFQNMIRIMNEASNDNGYDDTAEVWKEQLGIENIDEVVEKLYGELLPFYEMLHGFVRHRLMMFYGTEVIDPTAPIPAHLLGNMWAQSWSEIRDIIAPEFKGRENITANIKSNDWKVKDMVKLAEDYFASMEMPKMTDAFWAKSQFERPPATQKEPASCHPSSLDMYNPKKGDFRMELCGAQDEETLLTVHHEMGHVEYFMNYAHQPPIFRDGANPAFHEAIGDTINYGVQSRQHLKRLGLLNDDEDVIGELLHKALYRIPLIVWSYVVDRWRWDAFEGLIEPDEYNEHWWRLRERIQGVRAPVKRTEENFDPMAKFHIPDNTPYMPYFFSGFLQMQFFEGLCDIEHGNEVDLNECDLFGAKKAGEALKEMMQRGQSQPWRKVLPIITGRHDITSDALLKYYRPLIKWLETRVREENIPLGW